MLSLTDVLALTITDYLLSPYLNISLSNPIGRLGWFNYYITFSLRLQLRVSVYLLSLFCLLFLIELGPQFFDFSTGKTDSFEFFLLEAGRIT